MTPRKLLVLTGVALMLVAMAIWFSSQRHLPRAHGLYEPLFPVLATQTTSITAIDIFKAGDERAVQLKRNDNAWSVAERDGYPADVGKISALVTALKDAKLYEQKTSNPANYPQLGVEDVSAPTAKGVRVELEGLASVPRLIVGKKEAGTQSTFVRRAGEPESWLVHANIDASAEPQQWLATDLINIAADRVQEVNVAIAGAPPYSTVKTARTDAAFTVSPIPKGRELSSPSATNGFATALLNLTLDDVRAAKTFDGVAPDAHVTYKMFDGLVLELNGWVKDGVHWLTIRPASDPQNARKYFVAPAPAEPASKDQTQAASQTPAAATADTAIAAAKTDAEQMSKKTDGWVFSVADYKYDAIFKPLEELLKKPNVKSPAKKDAAKPVAKSP